MKKSTRFSIVLTTVLGLIGTVAKGEDPQGEGSPQPAEEGGAGEKSADSNVSPREVIAAFDYGDELNFEEARQLLRLAAAPLAIKLETIQLGLAEEESADRTGRHVAFLAKAAVGLDPSGETTKVIIEECIKPVVADRGSSEESLGVACQLLQHLPGKDAAPTADLLFERMLTGKKRRELGYLADAFMALIPALAADETRRLSQTVIEAISSRSWKDGLWLGDLLGTLGTRLEPADVRDLIAVLQERMRKEKRPSRLLQFGNAQLALALAPPPTPALAPQ